MYIKEQQLKRGSKDAKLKDEHVNFDREPLHQQPQTNHKDHIMIKDNNIDALNGQPSVFSMQNSNTK